jgi:hypothetical protein
VPLADVAQAYSASALPVGKMIKAKSTIPAQT